MRPLVDLMKVLADESRLKILYALEQKSCCVCQLAFFLKLTQPTVSAHLKQLRQAGLVDYTKSGKWVDYFLTEDPKIRDFLTQMKNFLPDRGKFEREIALINGVSRETGLQE